MRIGRAIRPTRTTEPSESGSQHVGIYGRLTHSLEHRLPKNNPTIARWRILTVLHHAGNQALIDLSIQASIGPSTRSRVTEGMQRRRLVAQTWFV